MSLKPRHSTTTAAVTRLAVIAEVSWVTSRVDYRTAVIEFCTVQRSTSSEGAFNFHCRRTVAGDSARSLFLIEQSFVIVPDGLFGGL
jgi:hypothetical protein